MADSRIKISIVIEADNVDQLVGEVLERFGFERKPLPKSTVRFEDTPPATNIAPRRVRVVR